MGDQNAANKQRASTRDAHDQRGPAIRPECSAGCLTMDQIAGVSSRGLTARGGVRSGPCRWRGVARDLVGDEQLKTAAGWPLLSNGRGVRALFVMARAKEMTPVRHNNSMLAAAAMMATGYAVTGSGTPVMDAGRAGRRASGGERVAYWRFASLPRGANVR